MIAVVAWWLWRPGGQFQTLLLAIAANLLATDAIKDLLKWAFGRPVPKVWFEGTPRGDRPRRLRLSSLRFRRNLPVVSVRACGGHLCSSVDPLAQPPAVAMGLPGSGRVDVRGLGRAELPFCRRRHRRSHARLDYGVLCDAHFSLAAGGRGPRKQSWQILLVQVANGNIAIFPDGPVSLFLTRCRVGT